MSEFILVPSEPVDCVKDTRTASHEPHFCMRAKDFGTLWKEDSLKHDLLLKQTPIGNFCQ